MPPTVPDAPAYRFGSFELDARSGELRKLGIRIKLQDQPRQILLLLLRHSGEVVTREQIQKRLWPDNTFVDFDNAINSAVRKLRDALGDTAENPRFVETVARRGYRFIASVSPVAVVPFRGAPSDRPSQPINAPVTPPWAATQTRRFVWIACTLLLVLGAVGTTLPWWISRSNQASRETPLPAVPLTGNRGYEEFPTFSP